MHDANQHRPTGTGTEAVPGTPSRSCGTEPLTVPSPHSDTTTGHCEHFRTYMARLTNGGDQTSGRSGSLRKDRDRIATGNVPAVTMRALMKKWSRYGEGLCPPPVWTFCYWHKLYFNKYINIIGTEQITNSPRIAIGVFAFSEGARRPTTTRDESAFQISCLL